MSLLLMSRGLWRPATSGGGGGSWTERFNVLRDFNSGTVGNAANGTADGFTSDAGRSLYDTTHVYEGAKSCKCTILTTDSESNGGNGGPGQWGGIIETPSDAVKGDDVWAEANIFFPAGFVITTPGNGSLKTIRLRTLTAGNANAGFLDLQHRDDSEPGSFRFIKEATEEDWLYFGPDGLVTRDSWHRLTLCAHLDNVAADNGGTGRVRVWYDGANVLDSGARRTLTNATDKLNALYLFTHWNGDVPQNQSCWIDALRIAAGTGTPSWASDLEGV